MLTIICEAIGQRYTGYAVRYWNKNTPLQKYSITSGQFEAMYGFIPEAGKTYRLEVNVAQEESK